MTITRAGRAFLVALLAASSNVLAQPELDQAATDAQRQLAEEIQDIQSREGSNSSDLIEPLTALAFSYQEDGDYVLSSAALQRALDVVRYNYGLYSLEQAPFLQQRIANEEAGGNHAVAWDLEQELLDLARRHPEDLRAVPIFRDIADKRMAMLDRYLAGESPPQIVLGCYYDLAQSDPTGSCRAGQRTIVFQRIVAEVQKHYSNAIAVLLRNELYSSDELQELETEFMRVTDLVRHRNELGDRTLETYEVHAHEHKEPWRSQIDAVIQLAQWDLKYWQDPSLRDEDQAKDRELALRRYLDQNHYELGRLSILRVIAYEDADSGSRLGRIDAQIRLADWDLLYSRNRLALDGYQRAYEQLEEAGVARASIAEFFSPATPVVLPTFILNPLVSGETAESTGYIDVSFGVTRFGRGRRVEILDSTPDVTRDDRDRLVQRVKRSRFRPRVTDGVLGDSPPITVRYYVNGSQ